MAVIDWDNVSASTKRHYIPVLVNNIFEGTYILKLMGGTKRAAKSTYDGGITIDVPIEYGTANGGWFQHWDVFNVNPIDFVAMMQIYPKRLQTNISISQQQIDDNKGSTVKIFDLVEAQTKNCERTIKKKLATGMFSDGTSDPNMMTGFKGSIDNGTNSPSSYGGFSRVNNSWWQAQYTDRNNQALTETLMASSWGDAADEEDVPDVIITTQDLFNEYALMLGEKKRYIQDILTYNAGATKIVFNGAPLVVANQCDTGYMYMLNMQYIYLKTHVDRLFSITPFQKPANQDGKVAQIIWYGNLVITNQKRQAKIIQIA